MIKDAFNAKAGIHLRASNWSDGGARGRAHFWKMEKVYTRHGKLTGPWSSYRSIIIPALDCAVIIIAIVVQFAVYSKCLKQKCVGFNSDTNIKSI